MQNLSDFLVILSARILTSSEWIRRQIEAMDSWYERSNTLFTIVPGFMAIHPVDFTLVIIGIFTLGWMTLRWIS